MPDYQKVLAYVVRLDKSGELELLVFTHRDQPVACTIECEIGMANIGFWRHRREGAVVVEAIDALVGIVLKIDRTADYREGRSAVFMYAGSSTPWSRQQLDDRAVRRPALDGIAPFFVGMLLGPIDGGAVQNDIFQADARSRHRFGRDGGFPGTVWRGLGHALDASCIGAKFL